MKKAYFIILALGSAIVLVIMVFPTKTNTSNPNLGSIYGSKAREGNHLLDALEGTYMEILQNPSIVSSYVSSGERGHQIIIYSVTSTEEQNRIIREVGRLFIPKNHGRIYLEFRNEERFIERGDGSKVRQEEVLRRELVE